MAHFAEIDPDTNIVLRVLVVPDDEEHRGQEFLADDLGLGGTWLQTSYNTTGGVHHEQIPQTRPAEGDEEGPQDAGTAPTPDGGTPLRWNFATRGGTYRPDVDAFVGLQPYPSWVLDDGFIWRPPTPDPTVEDGPDYLWDEDSESWVEVLDPNA